MQRGELVVGAAIRPNRIPPAAEHDEVIQVDSAATSGMFKIAHSVNLILIVTGSQP
jgi:hypothetical protein